MQHPTLDLPASVQNRACFAQFIGALAVDQSYFDQAVQQIQQVGMDNIWKANDANPPSLYNPSILSLAAALATQGHEVKLAGTRAGESFTDEAGIPAYAITKGTAIIPVHGPLSKQSSSLNSLFGGSNTVGMRKALALAMGDDRVDRVVWHVDSPGGTAVGTGDLADDIYAASAKKPIAAYIEDMGTSAAYFIASNAAQIYASPYANVGSIGVIWTIYDKSEAYQKAGIKVHAITSSPGKAFYVDGMPVTKQQFAKMQAYVDSHYQLFLTAVARGRGVSLAEAREMSGDADIYPADEALEVGLIDHVGPFSSALAHFAEHGKEFLRAPVVERALVSVGPAVREKRKPLPAVVGTGLSTVLETSNELAESAVGAGDVGLYTGSAIVPTEESSVTPDPPTAGQPAKADPKTPEPAAPNLSPEQVKELQAQAAQGAEALERVKRMEAAQATAATRALEQRRETLLATYPHVSKEAVAKCKDADALDALEEVAKASGKARTPADPQNGRKAEPTPAEEQQAEIAEFQKGLDARRDQLLDGGNLNEVG